MTATLTLLSVGLLLGLLAWGRWSAGVLFVVWAVVYHFSGLIDTKDLLSSYANPVLATLILLLLVSMALERSALLERTTASLLAGSESLASLKWPLTLHRAMLSGGTKPVLCLASCS